MHAYSPSQIRHLTRLPPPSARLPDHAPVPACPFPAINASATPDASPSASASPTVKPASGHSIFVIFILVAFMCSRSPLLL
jgi:hypothetical protein